MPFRDQFFQNPQIIFRFAPIIPNMLGITPLNNPQTNHQSTVVDKGSLYSAPELRQQANEKEGRRKDAHLGDVSMGQNYEVLDFRWF